MIPDNGGYATAAYIAAAVIYIGYALTLRSRMVKLRKLSEQQAAHDGGRH